MLKFLTTAAVLFSVGTSAMAESKAWNITEENISGVKNAQGTWAVTTEGDQVSGKAELQATNGAPLTYTLAGSLAGGVYTIKLENRSDGKKGCVWTGHQPSGTGMQAHGLIGEAVCEGAKLLIRAGF